MRAKSLEPQKSLLVALLALVTGAPLNMPVTARGAKLNLPETRPASATERGDESNVKEAFDKLPLHFLVKARRQKQPGAARAS